MNSLTGDCKYQSFETFERVDFKRFLVLHFAFSIRIDPLHSHPHPHAYNINLVTFIRWLNQHYIFVCNFTKQNPKRKTKLCAFISSNKTINLWQVVASTPNGVTQHWTLFFFVFSTLDSFFVVSCDWNLMSESALGDKNQF